MPLYNEEGGKILKGPRNFEAAKRCRNMRLHLALRANSGILWADGGNLTEGRYRQ
jgi:hypothetical protein